MNVAWGGGGMIGPIWFSAVSEQAGFMWAFASYCIVQSAFCLFVTFYLMWTKCHKKIDTYQIQMDE